MASIPAQSETVLDPKADTLIDETITGITPEVAPPSTVDNQLQTAQSNIDAGAEQERLDRAKKALSYEANRTEGNISDIDVQRKSIQQMREDDAKKAAKEQQIISTNREQSKLEFAKLTDDVESLKRDIDFAREKGIDTSALEKDLAVKSATLAELAQPLKSDLEATPADVERAYEPTVADVEKEAAPVREAAARQVAQIEEQQRQLLKAQEKEETIQKQIQLQDEKYKGVDPDRFWNNKSTGQRILAAIAVFMGGAAGGTNNALNYINQQIQNDIDAQKVDIEEAKARKSHALKLAQLQIQKISTGISNEVKRAQLQKLYSDIELQKQQVHAEREMAARVASGNGLSREEVFNLPEKQQDRYVILPDGKAYATLSAEDAKKLRQEVIPTVQSSLHSLNRLKEINEGFLSGSLDITGARKEAASLQQQLVGTLRLELFGPGVLTDSEQARAKEIIADPTRIFSLKGSNKTFLDTLESKLRFSMRNRLRASGVNIPPSQNDANLAVMKKSNPNASDANLIKALKSINKWNDNE